MAPGQVVELRAPKSRVGYGARTVSGYFDRAHLEDFAQAVAGIKAPAVYFTLNPVLPDLLSRAANRARALEKDEPTTTDKEIQARRWFFIDADASRPAGISATDEEKAASRDMAQRIAEHLAGLGWPSPVITDSGNGFHLYYRIDLPAEDGGLVGKVLAKLQGLFGSDAVKVDQTVKNPARITKLPGTPVRKGDDTPERPHRMARLLSVPESIQVVPTSFLEALVATAETGNETRNTDQGAKGSAFDVQAFIDRHSLDVSDPRSTGNGGQKWVFGVCPWRETDARGSAAIIQLASGAVWAACQHESCPGSKTKGNHWSDLRAKYGEAPSDNAGGVHAEEATEDPGGDLFEGDETITPAKPSGTPLIDLLLSGPDLSRLVIPPREMIVVPFIATGSINMVTAPRGLGKTFFGMELCRAVTRGQPFFEWHVPMARNVLFLDGEMPTSMLQERFSFLYGGTPSDRLSILPSESLWTKDKPLNLNEPESQARVQAMLDALGHQDRKPSLVIVDNLSSMSFGADENDNSVQDSILQWLMGLRHQGYAILLVHHTGKSGAQRGASRREDFLDTSIMLSPPDGEGQGDGAAFKIEFTKERGHKAKPAFLNVALEEDEHGNPIWTRPNVLPAYLRALLVIYQKHPDTATALGKAMDISRAAAQKHLDRLRQKGYLHPLKMAFTTKGNKAISDLLRECAA